MASSLIKCDHSTVVIERSDYRGARIGETLPPAVQPILVGLGVWKRFLAQGHAPSFGIRSAWGHDELYDNDFIFNPYGAGWHVDRGRFDEMLARCAEEAGAAVYRGARFLSCEKDEAGNWKIEIAGDDWTRRFRTRLVVDATGRASFLARKHGATRVTHDHLIAAVSFFTPPLARAAHESFTLVESMEEGWWYSAVLPDSRLVLAYMTDADLYATARKQGRNDWLRQLQGTTHTKSRVENYLLSSGPHILPANSSRLDRVAKGTWLAIGDAAMAFDPLSGQGVYKALDSGMRAARSVQKYFSGNTSALQDYSGGIEQDFDSYLQTRRVVYNKETRFPNSVFWQRRRSNHPFADRTS